MAIYDDLPCPTSVLLGALDLYATSKGRFEALLGLFDPIAVEPVLSGKCVHGDNDILPALQKELCATTSSPTTVRHLLGRSFECFNTTSMMVDQLQRGTTAFCYVRLIASNFLFAVSYWALAHYYSAPDVQAKRAGQVIAEQSPEAQAFWRRGHRLKTDGGRARDVKGVLDDWSCFLASQNDGSALTT